MTVTVSPASLVTVVGREWLDEDIFVLTCSRPPDFMFGAGQYVSLVHGGEEREYTLLSAPVAPELRFLIKRIDGGRLSSTLAALAPGTVLGMSMAKGYLTYRPTDRPVVFVATGVGIAPFVAMAAAGVTGFTLIQGARTASGLVFRRELRRAASRYIPCLSGANDPATELPDLYQGYVTGYVERFLAPGLYDFYLCGSRAMITDMTLLLDQHSPQARIFSEAYT
jgi:ferredoxin-NADP reductase